jgi:hypothetical protein
MFKALQNTPVGDKRLTAADAMQTLRVVKARQAGHRFAQATAAIINSGKVSGVLEDAADLRRLRSSIRTHGLNRSLLAVVNPKDTGIGRLIPGVPSIESVDMVPMAATDPRTISTISGIDGVLSAMPSVVADWMRTGATNLDMLFDSTREQLEGCDDMLDHYIAVLGNVDELPDGMGDSVVSAIPCPMAMDCTESLAEALTDYDMTMADPTDQDAMDQHREQMTNRVANIGEYTGLSISASDPYQIEYDPMASTLAPVADSCSAHGYTLETVVDLLEKTRALLDTVRAMLERKDELVGQVTAAADLVMALDNDVPPASDDAIDEPGEESLMGGTRTQADMIHSHMASHMCSMAAMCGATMQCMDNAMTVADHVDTMCSR